MNDKMILIIDDEKELLEMLRSIFERAGYHNILTGSSGREGLRLWRENHPDIIILDVKMAGMDGFQVLREIRRTSKVPVLLLTARAEAEDKIEGFESGADDYLAKPFLPRELLLRVKAILNRAYPRQERKVYLQDGMVDLDKAEVLRKNQIFSLTAKELQIFEKLWENAGRIVTTGALCETLCGEYWQGYETTLGTHIRHLREKIEEHPSKPVSLITIKGIGYRLNVKEEIL